MADSKYRKAYLERKDRKKVSYPKNHKPGMRVPKGGSMCQNCAYLKDAENRICGQPDFIKWNGSEVIPGPVDSYCSDFYEPAKGMMEKEHE